MASRRRSQLLVAVVLVAAVVGWWLRNRPDQLLKESGGYERHDGCELVEHRGNDGDSFHVRLPDGKRKQLRLYYVDAPETAFRRYRNGDDNGKRLDYQAEYFGGLTRQETTAVGKDAKDWVAGKLRGSRFTVFTRGELVYGGPRIYALLMVEAGGEERFLHELLVEEGLARIYTEGSRLPDGTSVDRQEGRLRNLERDARKARKGGWGK